jgi:hypothetical protein
MRVALVVLLLAGCEKKVAPLQRCVSQADCPVRWVCLDRVCVEPGSVGLHAVKPGMQEAAEAEAAPGPAAPPSPSPSPEPSGIFRVGRPKSFGQKVEKSLQRWDSRVQHGAAPLP